MTDKSKDTIGGHAGAHLSHWRQSVISEPGFADQSDVFFAAIQMTRMPMIISDPRQPDNPIAFANNAFLDLTGYEEKEVVGRNCRFLQGPGTDRETVREMREAIEAKRALAVEVLNYRRDGTPFWNAVFIGPIFDEKGELLYFFASQLDVTRRRESEQVSRQAQKMEAIGQLTAGLAHDFNNLLQVVGGSLERISAAPDDVDRVKRFVAVATTAAERGAKLTQQLLAFARRSRLEPKGVDLTDLVSSISDLLDSAVGSKIDLSLHLRRRLPRVMVDPVHLEMALLNVLVNARDASRQGGAVTVSTEPLSLNGDAAARHLAPGDYVTLTVADRGEGMPDHVLARATEPFFTTKPAGQGTGLGLAMAHGFAQQSGGRMEIESEPGKGTTVRLIFPVAAPADDDVQAPRGRFRPDAVDDDTPPRILVVDDNAEIAALARDTLVETGYEVAVALSGEEGLALFAAAQKEGAPFDLVFTDVVMPGGMNGLVFASQIRERSETAAVLMTTGYNDQMALDGPQAEAMDVLGKPYRRNELIDRVQTALKQGPRKGPGRRTSDFGIATA
ncbi:histidine kinase famiy protein [Brevundimonas sp. SORGH_AS_0993]|uniref:histidine kinase famiy protein n=1 Tax=Brevundimonas sp. SORGH_AS_0993 TaxID=3041794 RepID=UPI0027858C5D|nr:histidine kinase famiy protein [Brevundimonas sp. SORGH_AS_0993]MDQ1153679.1 PAS domain S-box-containing protein [Brevundimonas sp. SORGH_AS_0993]